MAVGDAHVLPGFLPPVLTQISFQSRPSLFSHASAEVRDENTPEKKFRLNRVSNSQPPGHESNDCFNSWTLPSELLALVSPG